MAIEFSGQTRFYWTVSGFSGTFAQGSAPGHSVPSARLRDGGSSTSKAITGRPSTEDITVSRPWDRDRDGPAFSAARDAIKGRGERRRALVLNETDADGVVVQSWTYAGLLTGVTGPEADAEGDTTAARLILTFTVDD